MRTRRIRLGATGRPVATRGRTRLLALAAAVAAFALVFAPGCERTHPPDEPRGPGEDERASGDQPAAGEDGGSERDDEVVPPSSGDGAGDEGAGDEDGAGDDGAGERIPYVDEDHDHFSRVEGEAFDNRCETDADCHVGGCSSEVCSAEPGVTTTCEMPEGGWASAGGSCGCLDGTCRWYEKADRGGDASGEDPSAESPRALEGQGESCERGECEDPLECVRYRGVAGERGPRFSSCEIPCAGGDDEVCPDGQGCVVIADGPGEVCRPRSGD